MSDCLEIKHEEIKYKSGSGLLHRKMNEKMQEKYIVIPLLQNRRQKQK